jgi:adenylate kinase
MKTSYILIMGLPGSGKGTLAKNLVSRFECKHISCGEVFRDEIRRQTPFGLNALKYIEKGQLTPDADTSRMFLAHLSALPSGAYLLEGYPRTMTQLQNFEQHLNETQRMLEAVLYLGVACDELIRRVTDRRTCSLCGAIYNLRTKLPRQPDTCDLDGASLVHRPDDQPAVAASRIALYEENEHDVVAYFQASATLKRLVAGVSAEDILEDAASVLAPVLTRRR